MLLKQDTFLHYLRNNFNFWTVYTISSSLGQLTGEVVYEKR